MVLAVIPSRYPSSRFFGKPLASVLGEPLVARVARRTLEAGVASQVVVATDDRRIAAAVGHLPVEVVLDAETRHHCGSDRVAAAVAGRPGEVVINVQGDEAQVDRQALLAALGALDGNDIGTVAAPLVDPALAGDPDAVKVSIGPGGRALDFSRASISGHDHLHVGLYAFARPALERFAGLEPSPRELAEGLEQLRAMEAGMHIGVGRVAGPHIAVNRQEDMAGLERALAATEQTRLAAGTI